ncbi:MAG: hypothetical protein WBL81_12635, partial [Pseudolabrys sp.]
SPVDLYLCVRAALARTTLALRSTISFCGVTSPVLWLENPTRSFCATVFVTKGNVLHDLCGITNLTVAPCE